MAPVTCPKCGKIIETFIFEETTKDISTYHIAREDYSDDRSVIVDEGYRCPKCKEVVFTSEQDMLKHIEEQEPE